MDRGFNEFQARAEAAEAALKTIHAAIAYWMPPDSGIEDQDLIAVITEILEEYGLPFVAPAAFESEETAPELPL
jgi:hypothetical protein